MESGAMRYALAPGNSPPAFSGLPLPFEARNAIFERNESVLARG